MKWSIQHTEITRMSFSTNSKLLHVRKKILNYDYIPIRGNGRDRLTPCDNAAELPIHILEWFVVSFTGKKRYPEKGKVTFWSGSYAEMSTASNIHQRLLSKPVHLNLYNLKCSVDWDYLYLVWIVFNISLLRMFDCC